MAGSTGTPRELTAADSGARLPARAGDSFVVRLDERPTTGYRWKVDHVDDDVLEVVDSTFRLEPDAARGGGSQREVTVRVKAAGTGRLSLVLARRWEQTGSHVDTFEVTIEALASD